MNILELQENEPHKGSLDTFQSLSTGKDGLERFRILYDFGQYVLNGVQGDIVEIGCGESSYYLSRLAERFNRQLWHCDISPSKIINPLTVPGYFSDINDITYFEDRDATPLPFKRVVCFAGSSNDLWKRTNIKEIAFAFIDGDHSYRQAMWDFWKVWPLLVEDGIVALHDTNPPDADWLDENRCGEVYKLRQVIQKEADCEALTIGRGCGVGVGITFAKKKRKGYLYG